MNKVFISERVSHTRYFVRNFILGVIGMAIILIYNYMFSNGSVVNSSFIYIGAVFIISFIVESFRTRISRIEFNTETRKIDFYISGVFTSTKHKTLRFDIARLEIDKKITWFAESLVIYFMNSKLEVFKVDKNKDGFSKETLEEIKLAAEEIGLPVSKY